MLFPLNKNVNKFLQNIFFWIDKFVCTVWSLLSYYKMYKSQIRTLLTYGGTLGFIKRDTATYIGPSFYVISTKRIHNDNAWCMLCAILTRVHKITQRTEIAIQSILRHIEWWRCKSRLWLRVLGFRPSKPYYCWRNRLFGDFLGTVPATFWFQCWPLDIGSPLQRWWRRHAGGYVYRAVSYEMTWSAASIQQ
jgi:hypothetical protein